MTSEGKPPKIFRGCFFISGKFNLYMASRPVWPSDLIDTFVDILTPDKFLAMAAKDSDIYVIDEDNGDEIPVHAEPG